MWAEMRPDLYVGKNCDEMKPQWHSECDGDRESETLGIITFDPASFPPGTKIIISQPCCPLCGLVQTTCVELGDCSFDWDVWCDRQYS